MIMSKETNIIMGLVTSYMTLIKITKILKYLTLSMLVFLFSDFVPFDILHQPLIICDFTKRLLF